MKCSLPLQFFFFFFALVAFAPGIFAQDDIIPNPSEMYGSDLKPPPHPELLPQGPVDYEVKNGVLKAHRHTEKMIETDPAKPVEMKKVKFGADVTEPTGVFKGSLLDSDLSLVPAKKKEARNAEAKATEIKKTDEKTGKEEKGATSETKTEPSPAAVNPLAGPRVDEIDKNAAPAQSLGLSLATSPSPAASAAPNPRP